MRNISQIDAMVQDLFRSLKHTKTCFTVAICATADDIHAAALGLAKQTREVCFVRHAARPCAAVRCSAWASQNKPEHYFA